MLYTHGMEGIVQGITPQVKYSDGIFEVRVDNRSGVPRQSPSGNLRVLFVAPTRDAFMRCGGTKSAGLLAYKANDKHVLEMVEVGRQMARTLLGVGSIARRLQRQDASTGASVHS
jgi:hypothetical protein